MKRYAVIPTHDRPMDFGDCLRAIRPQVDQVIVIAHRCSYPRTLWELGAHAVLDYPHETPNMSEMWNRGLNAAAADSDGPHYVAILNDDAIVPPTWFKEITDFMQHAGSTLGSAARDYDDRPAGFAFILDGTTGIRADEQFRWWYGDDDLQRQALALGGVAQVDGLVVEHRYPNSTTKGKLKFIADEDKKRFERKWG